MFITDSGREGQRERERKRQLTIVVLTVTRQWLGISDICLGHAQIGLATCPMCCFG